MTDATPTSTPDAAIGAAPLPTEKTLRMRQNLPFQAYRFAALNIKIMRIVFKGHHG